MTILSLLETSCPATVPPSAGLAPTPTSTITRDWNGTPMDTGTTEAEEEVVMGQK